jgi:hypothetical protein
MSLNAYERETVANTSDGDPVVNIWTAQAKFINRLKKHPRATLVREGTEDGTAWAEFTVPSNQWSPLSGIKRVSAPLSEERKQALRDRLNASRGA